MVKLLENINNKNENDKNVNKNDFWNEIFKSYPAAFGLYATYNSTV